MKANEFVKKFGWEYSKHILYEDSVFLVDLDYVHLKRLVESWELVEYGGGINASRRLLLAFYYKPLAQAIADVESCL